MSLNRGCYAREGIVLLPSESDALQRRAAWVAWIAQVEWDWTTTCTFSNPPRSADVALRAVPPWMNLIRRRCYGRGGLRPGVGPIWVAVAERGRIGRWHVHALLTLPTIGLKRGFDPDEAKMWWISKRGRIEIQPVTHGEGIARYLTKATAHGAVFELGPTFPRWGR